MSNPIRTLALAMTLTAALTPLAQAGGSTARPDGPFKDGTYLVRTANCGMPASMSVTATAEGKVNGQRKSLPLKLTSTKEKGVYQLQRTWPEQGEWLVRLQLGGAHRTVTLATFASNGEVSD